MLRTSHLEPAKKRLRGGACEEDALKGSKYTRDVNLDEYVDRTREALRALACRWEKEDVGAALRKLAEDSDAFTKESFDWSREVGLEFVLPAAAAACCQPSRVSLGRDALRASNAGGQALATHPALCVAPAPPCGFGAFATKRLEQGERLGEYTGEIRNYDVWCGEIRARKLALRGSTAASPFIPEELYCAWAGGGPEGVGVVIDAFAVGNAMRFINCSCSPNVSFRNFGAGSQGHHRLEVVTLRDIEAGEQLSVDYGWYFDAPTLEDIREHAVKAYTSDLPELREQARMVRASAEACAEATATRPDAAAGSIGSGVLSASGGTASCNAAGDAAGAAADGSAASAAAVGAAAGDGRQLRRSEAAEAVAAALRLPVDAEIGDGSEFLGRFLDAPRLRRFILDASDASSVFPPAASYLEIPDPVWHLYEVVGSQFVGVSCRCGLDPSLNSSGKCSGIIGRPLQSAHEGRDS